MCSSPDYPLPDLVSAMIQIPSTPVNCPEVVGLRLLAALRQPEVELGFVSNLWHLYALLRFTPSPGEHTLLLLAMLKDLPHEVRLDLAREVGRLTDASSVLLGKLLGQEQQILPANALRLSLPPDHSLH